MALVETVSKNIRLLREQAGLSQVKVSKQSGIDVRYISEIENAPSNLTLEMLEKLSAGLGVPPGVLVSADLKEPSIGTPVAGAAQGLRYAIKLLQAALKAVE